MDGHPTARSDLDPAAVGTLRDLSDAVVRRLARETRDGSVGDLRHLVGWQALVSVLAQMEPSARRTVCVLQPVYFYDPEDPGVELSRSARRRGVHTQLVTRPLTAQLHPLLPSIFPGTRLGPVFLRAMIVDGEHAMIGGEDTIEGDRTAWVTTRPELVAAVLEVWRHTLPLSVPILPPGVEPPLSQRQLDVARLVATGEKDAAIARRLEMSARTVERDVHAVLAELGARSRTEAVLLMRGRGVNGGQPGVG